MPNSCRTLAKRLVGVSALLTSAACPPLSTSQPIDSGRLRHDTVLSDDAGSSRDDAEVPHAAATPYPDGWPSQAGGDVGGATSACDYSQLASWTPIALTFDTPYRNLFAAYVGKQLRVLVEPNPFWQAGPLQVLDLDVVAGVPRILSTLTLPNSEGLEPYGFAADAQHIVVFTRDVPTNGIAMSLYDRQGVLEDTRSFGTGSFFSATAALGADGSVTLATSLWRENHPTVAGNNDGVALLETTIERRTAGRVTYTETSQGETQVVLAGRDDRIELVRDTDIYDVSDSGLRFLRALDTPGFLTPPSPYSAGWFGFSAAGVFQIMFAPEAGEPARYALGEFTSFGGGPHLAAESALGIAWALQANGQNTLAVLHSSGLDVFTLPNERSSPGMVAFANDTDVGMFYTSGYADAQRPLAYWGLHCPESPQGR